MNHGPAGSDSDRLDSKPGGEDHSPEGPPDPDGEPSLPPGIGAVPPDRGISSLNAAAGRCMENGTREQKPLNQGLLSSNILFD